MVDFKRRITLKTGVLLAASMLMLAACSKKEEPAPAVSAPAAAAAAPTAAAAGPLKVAFVLNGPIGDAGWSFAHSLAIKEVEKEFGDKIKVSWVDNVPEGADSERVFRDFATQGNKLIFGTSFGYMEQMLKVAKEFPDVKFEHATGYKTAANLAQYNVRNYEGSYLTGVIAGAMTKTNKLGIVASFPIPEVIRNIDAYTLGAQSVNPKVTTSVVWISTWFDPAKERDASNAMIGQGVDVLNQVTDSIASVQLAEEKGVYAFGIDSDMSKWGPKAHLASAAINWAPYYKQAIQNTLDGKWTNGSNWWGAKEGMTLMSSINPAIPEKIRKLVDEKLAGMTAGTFNAFTGPIVDASGKEMVAAGKAMPDEQLIGLNLYVKGVKGSIPK
ncbi:MAG: family transporter substrate-binding protein [Herbaspirillum sp.]|jgi:basic membrane protein A|nr:family transporter substrate-binding protein [Herbaspirillum sp.]